MNKRFVVVGLATAVAGLVLGASIVFGPDAADTDSTPIDTDIAAPDVTTPGGNGQPGARVNDFDYQTFELDDDGQLRGMRLRATRTRLKPLGITQLIQPRAEIRLGSQRAITIAADEADMQMEDRKPQAGRFTGNVVVTLFAAPQGTTLIIDPGNPAHAQFIQQRIYLDHATDFSIEDDTIDTHGPVHATSPQVDFFGIGLRLAYNTQRRRVEQLTINEGRYLIYNPDAPAAVVPDEAFADSDASVAAEADAVSPDADARADADVDADADASSPAVPVDQPSQFYAANFFDNIVVRQGRETELGGQQLAIDFSLGTKSVALPARPAATPDSADAAAKLPRYLLASRSRLAQADADSAESDQPPAPLPLIEIPAKNAERSLLVHNPDRDLLVTWTGPLRITPYNQKPDTLEDDRDVQLTLTGPNAYAQTTRDDQTDRIESTRLQHLLSKDRTTAFADDRPVRISSQALGGTLTAQRVTLQQQDATANLLGPGELIYTNQNDGKTLTLNWQNQLNLDLYTQQADAPQDRTRVQPQPTNSSATNVSNKLVGVKTATFVGQVTARHTDFDLDADQLTVAFAQPKDAVPATPAQDATPNRPAAAAQPAQPAVDNTPTAINASGRVNVLARGDADDEAFNIAAQRLSIDLELDNDREPYASAIRAVQEVRVNRPGSQLTCQRVEVELDPPSKTTQNTPTTGLPDQRFAEVRSILAVGDIRAKLDYDDRRIDLIADQLYADVQRDQLTLSANNTRVPAEIFDLGRQQKITGQLIVMDDQAESLDITGPGTLATRLTDRENPDATLEDSFLAIAWTKAMAFNNITGQARFQENVRSESRRTADASDLLCDELNMQFSPDYQHDPARLIDDDGKDNHKRQVRSAVATGNVKFTAAAWNPDTDDNKDVTNRMRLEGPRMVFTNTPARSIGQTPVETLYVDGPGRMLLEDYRPARNAQKPNENNQKQAVSMTGRGATLFTWQQSMLLNARTNTALLRDRVQMVHRPVNDENQPGDVVTLNGQTLNADLTDTGGLSVWLSDNAPQAKVAKITVDGSVQLRNANRAMAGDHLKYLADTNQLTLWTDPGRDVVLQDLERDASSRTNKVTWNLDTDRIEIDQLRGGVAPLN